MLSKDFQGGVLVMTGANSAVGLRSMPTRYLFMDEVDGYPQDIDGEGDPILLAERRTATFNKRKKIFLVSTPTIKGLSNIEREFENSDKRYFFVPCPFCGEFQKLEWVQIRAENGKAEEAYHKLMIGVKEVSVNVGNFSSVSYNQTSRAELAAYISNLKSQLAIAEGKPFGKRRIMEVMF